MTEVHEVTLLIVDHDELGRDEIQSVLENTRYPNRCMSPEVMAIQTIELEWTDEHPLNLIDKDAVRAEYRRLFHPTREER